jgi:ATP-binding cassette, subfamily B, bacterial
MALRSMSSDQSIKDQKLKAGTLKRILQFAKPYRRYLSIFIFTVAIDALLIVATPLLLRSLVDNGVVPGNRAVVTNLALIVGLLAIADAIFSALGRWFSSRIGEGLIYDLRSKVFEHVQGQSIAFFTRTQTGSLISRINSDVIGAQQAFTSTLSGIVSNSLTLVLVTIAMLTLSWQITVVSLILLPIFIVPTKWIGAKLANYTRRSDVLDDDRAL